uniref:hypothetical protein n=1 Tax=Anaerotignum sp. TaxID=2039241 RepID=UPI003736856E
MKGFALCMVTVFLIGNTAFAAEKTEKVAIPVHQTVVWDGTETKMPGYNIDGYTYFRLRDMAKMVSAYATNEMHYFDLRYQKETDSITIIRKQKKYQDSAEDKTFDVGTKNKKAYVSSSAVLLNDLDVTKIGLVEDGYVIDGYTFYKLRNIMRLLSMDVGWCEEEKVTEV